MDEAETGHDPDAQNVQTNSENTNQNAQNSLNIRLQNDTDFDMDNIIVNTSTGDESFPSLESNQFSDYKTFDTAYSYAYIYLTTVNDTIVLQPADYVGETPLANGNYTYKLNFYSQNDETELSIELIED